MLAESLKILKEGRTDIKTITQPLLKEIPAMALLIFTGLTGKLLPCDWDL